MAQHVLQDRHGDLYLGEEILIVMYPAGDCDTISWPFTEPRHATQLEKALYDLYQCTEELKEGDTVLLPDGTLFGHTESVHFIRD